MTVLLRGSVGARKWWALAGLSLGVLAVGLDATVLERGAADPGGVVPPPRPTCSGFVSAYTLALAVALLPGGLLGTGSGAGRS
jgi:hypothetical protein